MDFTVLRRAADGTLLGRSAGGEWQFLLPEGVKSKEAESAANLWSQSTIELKKDRKDKSANTVALQSVYAIVPGQDAAISAASLATDISLHKIPGASDAQAFEQMLGLIPEVVKAFPTGLAADTVRSYLSDGMSQRLSAWRYGDAEASVLDEASALSAASSVAFPSDASLNQLRSQVQLSRTWLVRRLAILHALDAGNQPDAFLVAYREFEPYDKSFEDMRKARARHFNASAAAHLENARVLQARAEYSGAIRHLLVAKWRSPKLAGVDDLLEEVRLQAAKLSAQKFAESRSNIDQRSPGRIQLHRKLLLAEQYLADGKQEEAEKALHEAESVDSDEPRLILLQARLAIARGELGRALALLDNYTGTAPTEQDLAEGEKLRASVLYTIDKERPTKLSQLSEAFSGQRFSAGLETAADALKLDNEAPEFLFNAGVNACVLRSCDRAAPLLHRYLDVTDSTEGDRTQRMAAIRLLHEGEAPPGVDNLSARLDKAAQNASWFSGTPLSRGVFYDPVSLAFQPRVARVEASEHVSVAYDWNGKSLRSVHTKYEEKKTGSNILKVAIAGAAASQGISSTVGWRTADRETNDFYFNYYDDVPQVMKVGRDNAIVKGRTIPITIPGIGGFGGLGMIGGLGGFGKMLGGLGGLKGMPGGLAGMKMQSGLGGASGLSGLSGGMLGRSASLNGAAGSSFGSARQFLESQKYSIRADPQGGSSAGYLTLWNNPRVDTRLAWKLSGKRAAVGFSGNRFFHPFVWDAIHLFELDYDERGRVVHAWELGQVNAPRIDFAWDGQRLLSVTARDASGKGPVIYSRVLNYSGERLMSETISQPGAKNARIEYKYHKQGWLVEADCDQDHTLDGRSRKAHFVPEGGE